MCSIIFVTCNMDVERTGRALIIEKEYVGIVVVGTLGLLSSETCKETENNEKGTILFLVLKM